MRQSIRIGRFAGVDVGINWSVAVIFGLITWELADLVLPGTTGSANRTADWIAAVVAALGFFGSLLAHEIAHAVVARRNGVGVRSITLWLFGGVAQLESDAKTPGADFRIAAVGPATSLLLAGVFALGETLAAHVTAGLPVVVLAWLWRINLLLAAFNVIPAAPLDGGRILRAGLWRVWADRRRSEIAAARAGRLFGVVLMVLGALWWIDGSLAGVWPFVLGLFLSTAAAGEEQVAKLRATVGRDRVGEVMTPSPPTASLRSTVGDLVRLAWHHPGDAVVLVDDHGFIAGVATAAAARRIAPHEQAVTPAVRIMTPVAALPVGRPEEPLDVLLDRMRATSGNPAVILDSQDRLAGVVTAADIERWAMDRRHRSAHV